MRIIQMIKYPFLCGMIMPFKIYSNSGIKIRHGATFSMKGRLTLGRSDKSRPVISMLPVNLYFGKNCKVEMGHSISVGQGVNIIVKENATFRVGDFTYFTSDAHIEAVNSIEIGSHCAISWGITIIDDDHHQLLPETQLNRKNKVLIGDHVWIGCNVTILKNTTIGNNCVIAAGSIVKGSYPDNTLIAGNPAKVIREEINWK